jgi:hypothetical protein
MGPALSPRRQGFVLWSRRMLSPANALLVGGLFGLAYWAWRRTKARQNGPRRAVLGRATIAVFSGLLIFGALFRTVVAIQGVPECPVVSDQSTHRPAHPAVDDLEKAITWPSSGLGMAYAQMRHGHRCYVSGEGLYLDEHHHSFFGRKSLTVGDVFLTRVRDKQSLQHRLDLFFHERHHRRQWAIATVLAGPIAFPVAYSIDNIFFPSARNHFEREAGLAAGGYDPEAQGGPSFRAVDIAMLAIVAGSAEAVARRGRRRRSRVAPELVIVQPSSQ